MKAAAIRNELSPFKNASFGPVITKNQSRNHFIFSPRRVVSDALHLAAHNMSCLSERDQFV